LNLLIDYLEKPLNETVNPDEVVALGAAIQAGIIAGEITDLILLDVTPLSLGVETLGGLMTTVINRNASIPVKQSETFSTGADSQESVEIHVLQGERPLAKDNKSLGIFKLKGIPPAPRGVPKIIVTFQLDVDGLLSVSAREEKSGQEQSIKIEGASVLAREDVSKMIRDAEENANLDKSKKSLITIIYEFDNFLIKAEKFLESSISLKEEEEMYFIQVLNKVKSLYSQKKLVECSSVIKKDLKNAINFLRAKYLQEQIFSNKNASGKKIIDTDFQNDV
jgi:molecular chaperone DnaK